MINFVRGLIVCLLLILSQSLAGQQEYDITIEGYIGQWKSTCGTNNNGLKSITLIFDDGSSERVWHKELQHINSLYEVTKTYPNAKKVVEVVFFVYSRDRGTLGCESSIDHTQRIRFIKSPCFYREYSNRELYGPNYNTPIGGLGGRGGKITITPKLTLSYTNGDDITAPHVACENEAIDIEATAGFTPVDLVYKWEFYNKFRLVRRNTPEFQALLDEMARISSHIRWCQDRSPGGGGKDWNGSPPPEVTHPDPGCRRSFARQNELFLEIRDLPEERKYWYENIADWEVITSKTGQSAIALKMEEMFPDVNQRDEMFNTNIRVRYNSECSTSGELTLIYLREPPAILSETVAQPTCAGDSAEVTLTFDRNIKDGEQIYINLLKRKDNGDLQPITSNILEGANHFTGDNGVWTYSFNRNNFDLGAGSYQLVMTGYNRITGNPKCQRPPFPFTVTPPQPVKYEAAISNHQQCFEEEDATITISNVRGGSGSYQYTLTDNNGFSKSGSFTTSSYEIKDLPPIVNFTLEVTDNKGCSDTLDFTGSITRASEITQGVVEVDHTGEPRANDGQIDILTIDGGTPINNNGSLMYQYILFDGTGVPVQSGTLPYRNAQIIGIGEGTYSIRYTDANGCTKDYIDFAEIKDPLPIDFDVEVTRNCNNASMGNITVRNIRGGYPRPDDSYIIRWYENGSNTPDVFNNDKLFITPNLDVVYRVEVTDVRSGKAIRNDLMIPANIAVDDNAIIITHNTIFGTNTGSIDLTTAISGGVPRPGSLPPYEITWTKSGDPSYSRSGESINDLLAGEYTATINDETGECPVTKVIRISEPEELIISINEDTPINCFGDIGVLSAQVQGGVANYTYQWFKNNESSAFSSNAAVTQLVSGTYEVEVTDSQGAFATASIVLTEPAVLELVSINKTDISCFGVNDGTITLNPQGGTQPYSFSIDNKATYISENDLTNFVIPGLSAGDYEVWLKDANECEITVPKSITIVSPEEIKVTPTIVHATTVGGTNGSIAIDVTGNIGNATFVWTKQGDASFNRITKNIDNLSFGLYTVAVSDDNCTIEKTFEVKEPLPLEVTIDITTPILCHADALGELHATVSGGYPIVSTPADFEYRWFKVENGIDIAINTNVTLTSIQNLEAGTYKVVVNDSQGATQETTLALSEPDDLVVTLVSEPVHVLCYGEATGSIDITVVGGPIDPNTGAYLPYSFNWTKVGDPSFTSSSEDLINIEAGTYQVVIVDDNLCTTTLDQAVIVQQPSTPLEISNLLVTHLTGHQTGNGSITMDIAGGTSPYQYEWIDLEDALFTAATKDIFNLKKGNYQLTITDANNCSISITEQVTEPEELIVTIEALTATEGIQCNGETTVVPLTSGTTGGVGNYMYQWYEQNDPSTILFTTSDMQTTVLAGTYFVVVTDANGNTDSDSYEVLEPELLSTSEVVTHLQCAGDSNGRIDVTTIGGVPPYSYLWSNGETTEDLIGTVVAGNYTLTVTDANNCVFQKTITIEQPPALFVDGDIIRLYPSANGLRDGSITINIGGGVLPYSYEWRDSNGVIQGSTTNVLSNIGVEKYAITITDANGCTLVIDDVDIFEPPALSVDIRPVNVISCHGNTTTGSISAIATGGRPFNNVKQYDYQWFNADTGLPVGGDSFLLENIGSANYYVTVSDAAGTTATSSWYELEQPDELELTLKADYSNCGDGNDWTVVTEIKGGTPPYNYLWSNGETNDRLENVVADTYSLTITDSRGCSITNQLDIVVPDQLSITTELITIPTCYNGCDGSIVLETEGGAPPYTYQWSNGSTQEDIDNLCSAIYTVTITDSKGCQLQRELTIDSPDELIVDLGEDVTLCKDQSIFLNATIADENATYLWTTTNGFSSASASIEVAETAIYTVVVTDSKGCVATDEIFINATLDSIGANFIASTQVFVGEEFVIVDNSNPIPDLVDWIFPEEATVTYTDNNYAEAFFDTPGEYEITMQTHKGLCTEITSKKIIVIEKEFDGEEENSEADIENTIDYLVYPNPTSNGKFTINVNLSKSNAISLKTFNMVNNTLIDSKEADGKDSYTFNYDMSIFPSGIYFVLLETPSGSQVRKIIIE